MNHLATNLRAARARLGLSQGELAQKADVSVGTVCEVEKGYRQPQAATVLKLADALGVSMESLESPPATSNGEPTRDVLGGPESGGRTDHTPADRPASDTEQDSAASTNPPAA